MRLKSFETYFQSRRRERLISWMQSISPGTCAKGTELMARRLNIELDFGDCKRMVGPIEWVPSRLVAAVEWDAGSPPPSCRGIFARLKGVIIGCLLTNADSA